MPNSADSHIQKIAPGPPAIIAVATPATLPVPTWAEIATASAWKEEIVRPSRSVCCSLYKRPNTCRTAGPKRRNCGAPRYTVKNRPTPTNAYISTEQLTLLKIQINWIKCITIIKKWQGENNLFCQIVIDSIFHPPAPCLRHAIQLCPSQEKYV